MSVQNMRELLHSPRSTHLQRLSARLFIATLEETRERFHRYVANNLIGTGFEPEDGIYEAVLARMGKSHRDYCDGANGVMRRAVEKTIEVFDTGLTIFCEDESRSEGVAIADLYEQVQDNAAVGAYISMIHRDEGLFDRIDGGGCED